VARKKERRVAYRDLLGRREGRSPLGTRILDGTIILKLILEV